jgi:hypothetical protein
MPPTVADRLAHILNAIDAIEVILANKTLDEFSADLPVGWRLSAHSKSSARRLIGCRKMSRRRRN